jgi:hypothetical protein
VDKGIPSPIRPIAPQCLPEAQNARRQPFRARHATPDRGDASAASDDPAPSPAANQSAHRCSNTGEDGPDQEPARTRHHTDHRFASSWIANYLVCAPVEGASGRQIFWREASPGDAPSKKRTAVFACVIRRLATPAHFHTHAVFEVDHAAPGHLLPPLLMFTTEFNTARIPTRSSWSLARSG